MRTEVMPLIDTHCHIDLYADYQDVLKGVEQQRIATIAVTNSPVVFRRSASLAAGSKYVRTAIGLHPELAAQRSYEVGLLVEMLGETRFVGEIGLDFVTNDAGEREVQRRVFATILDACSRHGDKVLTVHSRLAAREVVEMIGAGFPGAVILHWYSGPLAVLEKALKNGCYFSINPSMVRSKAGRRIIQAIPRNRLLTESDGPFATTNDQPSVPADVLTAVTHVAHLWEISVIEASNQIYQNFRRMISQNYKSNQ